MNVISFMSANFVARQLGYHMTEGWMQGDAATIAWFRPIETFEARFGAMLDEVVGIGFSAIDIWGAHLHPAWATAEHIAIAKRLLTDRKLTVNSLATFYGSTAAEVTHLCELAHALGTNVIGGGIPLLETDRAATFDLLHTHNVRLGIENHPEKSAAEIRTRIGESDGQVGACVDTGWFGTYGVDAAQALIDLAPYLVHIHLKDVRAAGSHETCRFGEGVVGIEACVRAIKQIGYQGPISIEHEPDSFDPREDVRASDVLLQQWMQEG